MALDEIESDPPYKTASGAPEFFKNVPTQYLEQGDIIPKSSPVIQEIVRQFYPYPVDKLGNEMFAVLTQSCDLVIRSDGKPKARYIALAPLRSLRSILKSEFKDFLSEAPGGIYYGSEATKQRYDNFLEKVINNNESRYFFIPQRPEQEIAEDMCIMLALSMSIRIDHYNDCLKYRTAQITDLFQAKLGWLLGQQFSRVGTPDWDTGELKRKVENVRDRALTWMPDHKMRQIKSEVKKFEQENPGTSLEYEKFLEMCQNLKDKRELVISSVIDVLIRLGKFTSSSDPEVKRVRNELSRDPEIARCLPKK